MTTNMFTVDEPNLSWAWGRALIEIVDKPGLRIAPLVLNITNPKGASIEDSAIRLALDAALINSGDQSVQTVANTIFPSTLWRIASGNRKRLFYLYKKNLPRYRKLEPHRNRRGLYFERLIDFGPNVPEDGNQLEYILKSYAERKGVRQSKFQAAIFDPVRDHVPDARLGFPCLQHISLVPAKTVVSMNAFYATQLIFEKAYGNFLGLWRLGEFMAGEMGLTLENLTCVIGVEKLDVSKASIKNLVDVIRPIVP